MALAGVLSGHSSLICISIANASVSASEHDANSKVIVKHGISLQGTTRMSFALRVLLVGGPSAAMRVSVNLILDTSTSSKRADRSLATAIFFFAVARMAASRRRYVRVSL